MPELARTRHDPTPRNASLPLQATVTTALSFVQSCPDCRLIAANFAHGCIHDASVSQLTLRPGGKHCHEVTEGRTALPGLTKPLAQSKSDTNGDDPDDVGLFCEAELQAWSHGGHDTTAIPTGYTE